MALARVASGLVRDGPGEVPCCFRSHSGQLWLITSGLVVMGLAVLPLLARRGHPGQDRSAELGLLRRVIRCGPGPNSIPAGASHPAEPHERHCGDANAGSASSAQYRCYPTGRRHDGTCVRRVADRTEGSPLDLGASTLDILKWLKGWLLERVRSARGSGRSRATVALVTDRARMVVYLITSSEGRGRPAPPAYRLRPPEASVVMEASTSLMLTVYPHLNAYCDIEVRVGIAGWSSSFRPAPGVPIEVKKFDYPSGRLARFGLRPGRPDFSRGRGRERREGPVPYPAARASRLGGDPDLLAYEIKGRRPAANLAARLVCPGGHNAFTDYGLGARRSTQSSLIWWTVHHHRSRRSS